MNKSDTISIKKAAFKLCKDIHSSKLLPSIRERILMSKSQKGPDGDKRYAYMDMNRASRMKLLELLLTDQNREQYEAQLPLSSPIASLTDQERETLTSVHKAFIKLNRACCKKILDAIPECHKAINPFFGRNYKPKVDPNPSKVISDESIDEFASVFSEHPAIQIALDTKGSGLSPEKYNVLTNEFVKSLSRMNDKVRPRNFFSDLTDKSAPKNMASRQLSIQLLSIFCIRESLDVLNQLVYQALVSDQLFALDIDNLIEIGQISKDLFGREIEVSYLMGSKNEWIQPFDLIILDYKRLSYLDTKLFRTGGLSFSLMQGTVDVKLRPIDKDINPHSTLLRELKKSVS